MANDLADVRLVKADATSDILALILDRGMTLDEAAGLAGIDVATLIGIVHHFPEGVDGVSLERLDKIVEALEVAPGRKPR
ncbi:helix-turn-helix transcriptional regulator [Mesorhizobium sp. M1409]|uniref:helix-turn-helix domain-containing protein n=1 Tax=unclassified Mesorhizobium TaxID=325217 RepID=UPI00333AD651